MTETNEYSVFPALRWEASRAFELHLGAEAKVVQTKGGDSLVEQQQVVRRRHVRRGGPARRARVRHARPQRGHDGAARHGRARRHRRRPGPPGDRREAPGRWLLRPEGLGRGRELRRRRGQPRGSTSATSGWRSPRASAVGRRAATTRGSSRPRSRERSTTSAATTTADTAATSPSSATPELRWWIGKRKRGVLPIRWGLNTFVESGRVWTRARTRRGGTRDTAWG